MNPFSFSGFSASEPKHKTPIIRFDASEEEHPSKDADVEEVRQCGVC